MKKLKLITMLSILMMAVCSLSGCLQDEGPRVISVALIQKDSHPETLALHKFGERLKELTEGRYEIKIYNDSTLGTQKQTLLSVQNGVLDMAVIGNSIVITFEPAFGAFSAPYIFEDTDHYLRFFQSDYPKKLYTKTENYNFKILTQFFAGARNIYATRAVRNLEDLKGLRIRTNEAEINFHMMNALGANAQPMALSNVYDAIKNGILDGAENNEPSYASFKNYEAAPYYSYTQHLILPDFLVINMNFYLSMSEKDRAALLRAVEETEVYERELWFENVDQSIAEAEAAGAVFVHDVNVQQLKRAVEGITKNFCAMSKEISEVCAEIAKAK